MRDPAARDPDHPDPHHVFRFGVERGVSEIAGFSAVSGLTRETTIEEYREGGVNGYVHKLANVSKFPNLTLKRGLTKSDELWAWHQDVLEGRIEREDLKIVLRNEEGSDTWRWTVSMAYPVKWIGGELDASQGGVFVESVEFAHQGVIGSAG